MAVARREGEKTEKDRSFIEKMRLLSFFIDRRGVWERRTVGRRDTPSGPPTSRRLRRVGSGPQGPGGVETEERREDGVSVVVPSALPAEVQEAEVQRGVVSRVLARCRRLEVGVGRP